ncbi:rho guanine nucleotide exchange factor TIAM2 [Platichthys flesus]|uniref:rho guanine nucleotide exchange factor TIAM2 n=1 Tax=Platichthys flesus TaxID=8260 RepID=UPI002DBC22D6|nr:rho guanine nucleotide exchange factor TIAM2 [Platichthys flesus]
MGNTESHTSFVSAAKPSCSLRSSSRKEEAPSARSWWRSSQGGCRSRGRSCQNQNSSWHYEHGPRGGSRLRAASPQRNSRGSCRSQFGYPENGGEGNGIGGERKSLESGGSPKVLLSKDGSMRVEFSNSRVDPMEPQGLTGVPAISTTAASSEAEPLLRTSKGSSLSSDGSWYDSPWGGSAELADNVFVCGQIADNPTYSSPRTEVSSTGVFNTFFSAQVEVVSPGFHSTLLFPAAGYNTGSSRRTEDSGIGDSVILQPELRDFSLVSSPAASLDSVYSSHNTLPAFPPAPHPPRAASSSTLLDDVSQEEEGFSSLTLPCRRAESISTAPAPANNRKDFLKSRIRQLSDWTGSLSRKKRRIQEPSDVSINGLSSAASTSDLLHPPCGSRGLNHISNAQRQNIYENFMQELETSCSGAADQAELSEEEEEQEEEQEEEDMDGGVELGGIEQLDVLFEKEQGVVRRAGWLFFKPLITVNKDGKMELVGRRRWRHYWVTLKGCTLLLHETYGRSGGTEPDLSPRYALLAEDSIVQAVPEHPKREHVFCLSNSYGDVYLFQATNQTELENWVTSVHSAGASLLARRQGKEDTLRLLRCRSRSLLHKIDMDGKMKKMAELQLSVIKEQKNRKAVESQIKQWEQNLEKLNLDLFRLKCYLSSLQGDELPNPKSLLAIASRPSKSMLGRLGVFSVSSFHALVCSRDEVTLRRRGRSLSGGNHRWRGLPSSLKALDRSSSLSTSQRLDSEDTQWGVLPSAGRPAAVQMCDEGSVLGSFSLHVCRDAAGRGFGFVVTGHLDGAGRSHVHVSEVDPLGPSAREGLRAGDEVLAVNGASVSGLDLDLMQSLFSHQELQLLLRRDESPEEEPAAVWPEPGEPAGPWEPAAPDLHTWATGDLSPGAVLPPGPDDAHLKGQNMEQVYSLYQTFPEGRAADPDVPKNPYSREVTLQPTSPAHMSVCQHLRKVIQELVDTEKSYVKDLVCLLDVYLTPLQTETFLSKAEMEALFGSLPQMLDFQRVFLQTLEEKISSCPDLSRLETPEQFKKLLFSLGGSFLYYADHFKLYSGFCANHIKVQKVLERAKTDRAFKHFLETRNPTNQHSSCLESYLIKPVQRVLKYPLLLRELVTLTPPESPEHTHLTEALRAMEKVASHINEMQKIHEDYGCVFDQLTAEQGGADTQVTDVSMGEFLIHSAVAWLNPLPCVGRVRRDPQLTVFVFRRAVILVYRDNNKLKKKTMSTRSADLDPFRFRWLIPVSAVQVRPVSITGSENPCVWELVHSRSEVEGRPETVFQLCSSGLETKASVLRVLSSVLKERGPAGSLRRTRLSTAERSSSWRRRQQRSRASAQRTTPHRQPEESRFILGDTCSEPLLPSHATADSSGGKRTRLLSLTSELEAQLQRLNVTEEAEQRATTPSGDRRAAEKRRSSSLQRRPGGDVLDLLDRDFSVHSMTSMINEDSFYDFQTPAAPSLQG